MSTAIELRVPDIGDAKDVAIIEVLVQVGDQVSKDQNLIVLETDKATMEIPAEHAGVIRALKVKVGGTVNQGDVIALMDAQEAASDAPVTLTQDAEKPKAVDKGGSNGAPAPEAPAADSGTDAFDNAIRQEHHESVDGADTPLPLASKESPAALAETTDEGLMPYASPSIRKMARELGVSLAKVRGSGTRGRITAADVRGYVKRKVQAPPAAEPGAALSELMSWPKVDFAKFGAIERRDLSRIRKISGAALHRNWVTIPHVTNHETADITELEAFRLQLNAERQKAGVKFTLLAMIIKASVAALKKFPEFNASLEGEQVVLKHYWHIGFAVDTPNGVLVPVIRDADQKGLIEIARETAGLGAKARDGKLTAADMSGGSFSISSLGGIGGSFFTPIINAPEVAILGVGKGDMQVRWNGEQAVPRLMLPLSLSWDHRVVDGAAAGRFNAYLAALLADFRRVML